MRTASGPWAPCSAWWAWRSCSSACGSAGQIPAGAGQSATTTDYRYVIGPGDTVNIIVWRNPELSLTAPVRPDDRISTPLVEDLQAVGRSPSDLARDVEKALSKYARDPVATVIVTGFQGAVGETIRIIGEAARPQAIPYRQDMTLLDVMIQVGGLTDFADGNAAPCWCVARKTASNTACGSRT